MRNVSSWIAAVSILFLSAGWPSPATSQTVDWIRQFGTSSMDYSEGISADRLENVYISGTTYGSLGGPNAGLDDAFVSKYNAAGMLLWSRQLGTNSFDASLGVSADNLGNVYISGYTEGDLGGPNAGNHDAFVSKYDAEGTLQWTRQLGTSSRDESCAVSADGLGNVYISGWTSGGLEGSGLAGIGEAFVSKYDSAGVLQWTRQLRMANSSGESVSADGLGNIYISGCVVDSSFDAFVSKYDATGALQWTRTLGTSAQDYSFGVSADRLGNVYIIGNTEGDIGGPNAGDFDVFVSQYDATGTLHWTRQLGTAAEDRSYGGMAADGMGNVYISGRTDGDLGGPNAGTADAFVSKYDAAGSLLWTRQFGTSEWDEARSVLTDGMGHVYFTGYTAGDLGGPSAGTWDAFVARISEVPEPSALVLALVTVVCLAGWRSRAN